tara:strand:- start:594 stop:1109 length:516 start_codon:yes stop_codon:yes gene_type:complete
MAIYKNRRVLTNQEIDALLTAWPTTDVDGSTVATHSDLVAEADFDSGTNKVKAAIAAKAKLVSAGLSAANDEIAPQWSVVTLPADTTSGDGWSTTWEDIAKNIAEANTGDYVEKVVNNYKMETITDENGDEITQEVYPFVILSKSGNWRIRDRDDRWLGATGYLAEIDALL